MLVRAASLYSIAPFRCLRRFFKLTKEELARLEKCERRAGIGALEAAVLTRVAIQGHDKEK